MIAQRTHTGIRNRAFLIGSICSAIALIMLIGGCPPPPGNPSSSDGSGTVDDGGSGSGGDTDGGSSDGGSDGADDGGTDGGSSGDDGSSDDGSSGGSQDPSGGDDGSTDGGSTDGGDSGSGDDGSSDGGTDGSGDDGGSDGGGIDDGIDDGGSDGGSDGGTDGDDGSGDGGTDGGGDDGSGDDPPPPPPSSIVHTVVASTGDEVPGQPAGVVFTKLGTPVIDDAGRAAFWALYDGDNANGASGLFYLDDDDVLKVAVNDDPATAGIVPDRTGDDIFGWPTGLENGNFDPLVQDIAWGKGGRLLFVSASSGSENSRGIYRYRVSDGDIVRVANLEMIAEFYPDATDNGFSPELYLPGVSDAGLAVFGVDYLYLTPPPNPSFVEGTAVYTSNGISLTQVADSVQSQAQPGDVPDQGGSAAFTKLDVLTTISPGGDVIFKGYYTSSGSHLGFYLRRSGTSYRVIDTRSGASWPGLPVGTVVLNEIFDEKYPFAVGPQGHMAIRLDLDDGSGRRDAAILWDWGVGAWTELTGNSGASATALLTGVNDDGQAVILAGESPYLASRVGRTRLDATLPASLQGVELRWMSEGGSINNYGRAVLPFADASDHEGLAMWTGEALLIVADAATDTPLADIYDIQTLTDPREDRPGRTGMFNDADEVVFLLNRLGADGQADTADDEQSIYIARGE